MTDYIKREDAIRIARIQGKKAQFDGMAQDVAPVRHGRWIKGRCSICGEDALLDDVENEFLSKYCPNCGAIMDGGTDNETD